MKKLITLTLVALSASFASRAIVFGPTSICAGSTGYYYDSLSAPGGTWSSSNTAIASIGATSGTSVTVNGVAPGVATISYVAGSTVSTMAITVNAAPAPIVGGGGFLCSGSSLTLTDATPGGTWYGGSGHATVASATGVVTGTSFGVATIYYAVGGCTVSTNLTINVTPSDSILGASTVCVGSTIALTNSISGGTWSSGTPGVATVSSTGVVTGVSGGTTTISYTVTGACGPVTRTHVVTVPSGTPSAGSLSGVTSINVGATGSVYSTVSGGVWSSSTPAVGTISASGIVGGISAGTTTISYAVTSSCTGLTGYATRVVTVNALNGISGNITGPTGSCMYKVWLIKYNPSTMMLSAVDSTYAYTSTGSATYQFNGVPTDSYRVKAAIDSFTIGGFVPTYHNSSFYWNTANVINHVAPSMDINKDINMIAGTAGTGPGFIGGSVLSGANKGTADGAPVVGLGIYLLNSATNAVMGYTKTDATGNYSFTSLPAGSYYTFPEELSYMTTPYTGINITSGSSSMNTANFIKHTVSHTITPVGTAVSAVSNNASIVAYPNPASGKLSISWSAASAQQATAVIADVTGRVLYTNTFNMAAGSGAEQVDVTSFSAGTYFLSVKAGDNTYVSKIEVKH